jgi:hypothetical protein
MSKRRQQISVPLEPELRAFVEQQAIEQDRSVAGQIRNFVAEAARKTPNRRPEKVR